jgi:hypothetical protein
MQSLSSNNSFISFKRSNKSRGTGLHHSGLLAAELTAPLLQPLQPHLHFSLSLILDRRIIRRLFYIGQICFSYPTLKKTFNCVLYFSKCWVSMTSLWNRITLSNTFTQTMTEKIINNRGIAC